MPVYRLSNRPEFPPAHRAGRGGLLAVGGDLSRERLLRAYAEGIFPWYSEGEPILWWSPDPRFVLFPDKFHLPRRTERIRRQSTFRIAADTAFAEVVRACGTVPRPGQDGTWITPEIERAYADLHAHGYAHSIECWRNNALVGGLYGVSMGSCFFGESMFSHCDNASKIALAALIDAARAWNFSVIDCQVYTPHLARLGAEDIPRETFLRLLKIGLRAPDKIGRWNLDTPSSPRCAGETVRSQIGE